MHTTSTSPLGLLLCISLPLVASFGSSLKANAQIAKPTIDFEVVSIKPSPPDCTLVMIGPSDDGFHLHCVTLLQLTKYAFGLNLSEESSVFGLPKWATNDDFDLDAPIRNGDLSRFEELPPLEKSSLLRSTLVDRFSLHFHWARRNLPIYALVRGKPPLKLKPTLRKVSQKPTLLSKQNRITAYHCTMREFASFISPLQGRRVVDHTGISGEYDFSLAFTPEANTSSATSPAITEDASPSIFTAVQEQLGLLLHSDKAWVKVLVVDAVSRPEPN